jgi:hypothetical protein
MQRGGDYDDEGAILIAPARQRFGKRGTTRAAGDVGARSNKRLKQQAKGHKAAVRNTAFYIPGAPPAMTEPVSQTGRGSRQKPRLLPAATKPLSEKTAKGQFFPIYNASFLQ